MKDIALQQLEDQFGEPFVRALKEAVLQQSGEDHSVDAWPVGQAKDHFSEMLDRVRDGEGQLVRRRAEDPVLMISMSQLAAFVEMAAPKRRFSDVIAHDPELPIGSPLNISDAAVGQDNIEL